MRSPVGGLFRHVVDLSQEQIRRGFSVGIVCDRETGGERAAETLLDLGASYALGVHRIAMPRLPGWGDIASVRAARAIVATAGVDIIHGHGAKGGAYARLAARALADTAGPRPCFYTPHGGTLHYDPRSLQGRIFFGFERWAQRATSAIVFESRYGLGVYGRKVGEPDCPQVVVHNGLKLAEFAPVATVPDPYDLLFIGEMRRLKGVTVLLDALAALRGRGFDVRTLLVGNGPDEEAFKARVRALDLADLVTFMPAMPARDAFIRARAVVVPSLNESLPYIVLEAAAAGMPMVATAVGGIPEIFAGEAHRLVAPGDAVRLADAIEKVHMGRQQAALAAARLRATLVRRFSVSTMADGVAEAYRRFAGLPAAKVERLADSLSATVDERSA